MQFMWLIIRGALTSFSSSNEKWFKISPVSFNSLDFGSRYLWLKWALAHEQDIGERWIRQNCFMHAKIDLKIMIEGTHELICLRDEKGGGGRDIRWRVIVLEGSGGGRRDYIVWLCFRQLSDPPLGRSVWKWNRHFSIKLVAFNTDFGNKWFVLQSGWQSAPQNFKWKHQIIAGESSRIVQQKNT